MSVGETERKRESDRSTMSDYLVSTVPKHVLTCALYNRHGSCFVHPFPAFSPLFLSLSSCLSIFLLSLCSLSHPLFHVVCSSVVRTHLLSVKRKPGACVCALCIESARNRWPERVRGRRERVRSRNRWSKRERER